VALVASFLRDQAAMQLSTTKKLTLTAVYNAVEQISNDIAKYRFPLTKKNNRESKPNHPAHKLVSFRLTA
jgi:phage portal protein BeeE